MIVSEGKIQERLIEIQEYVKHLNASRPWSGRDLALHNCTVKTAVLKWVLSLKQEQ